MSRTRKRESGANRKYKILKKESTRKETSKKHKYKKDTMD